jgi:DNA-binding transcriptional MerR regulator
LRQIRIRSLRYYEEQGLLHPERMASGYRMYADADVVRVQRIQALLTSGLSTQKVKHILPCMMQHRDGLRLLCADLYDDLLAERKSLLDRIATLRASVNALDVIIAASPAT